MLPTPNGFRYTEDGTPIPKILYHLRTSHASGKSAGCYFHTQKEVQAMARKKKNALPSGNIRIQIYDYTDADGKKHYKSFTAPTKKEAKDMAARWRNEKSKEKPMRITLYNAVERYINVKAGVLSPSTIQGYSMILKHQLNEIGKLYLDELNSTNVQLWISDISQNLSPKTVRNVYGLFAATVDMFMPDLHLRVTLPEKKRPELYCPSDEDIRKLLKAIEGTELEIAVLLAAFGPMRRGEICALESTDISGNKISVTKSMVFGPDHQWHIKQPKTYGSYRTIEFPEFVIKKIRGRNGRIVNLYPNGVSNRFKAVIKKAGLPHFRFHDLRHYSASIMHAIGVPDQYILQRGGWASDNVMKSIYRNSIDIETVRQTKKINQHFENIV